MEPAGSGRTRRHLSVRAAVAVFAVSGLVAVVVIAVGVAIVARRDATDAAVRDARDLTAAEGEAAVAPLITDAVVNGDPAAVADLDRVVRDHILSTRVVRVKIWGADGTILYSDEPSLIGRTFELEDDERTALQVGGSHADVSDLSRPENELERPFHKLLEVYVGIDTPSHRPVLYEAYLRFSSVSDASHRTFTAMLPVLLAGLGILFVVQVPLAWTLARRVERGRVEEQRLLRRAIDAGNVERRHLAADLHDGVVQSLVGTSLTLSAAADEVRRAGLDDTADRIDGGADALRRDVRDLRSLIVAIAPPKLHEEGLAAALRDLVSPLTARGIEPTLDVDPDLRLPDEVETLLYRSAQEAVRNVVRHAHASRVSIAVARDNGRVELRVDDDGAGFDGATLATRRGDGHMGLALLAELATESGGSLTTDSQPGAGTSVRIEVPVP